MELKFTVQTKIQKPVHEVFDAVYNPSKLSEYFTTGGASAPLDPNTVVMWEFADYPGAFPVRVKEVVPDRLIAFEWDAGEGSEDASGEKQVTTHQGIVCRVEMRFEPLDNGSTLVSITESGWPETQKGLELSYGNCHGWTQMSCSLKGWLEYGINLRKGAY
jgi:uncharacterized protein YndB with AHSA1/START domain